MKSTRKLPSSKARERWTDILALLALAVLTLLFFYRIALSNRVLAGVDVFGYFYPYRDFASEALRSGRLPLWNPYLFMGAPLLANSQTAVLYPLNWPLIWLSTPKQIAWSIVLHIWLAAGGTYLFARRAVRLGPLASFVSALVFALGGFLGAQVEHVNQLNASAWLPWLLLCLEGALGRGRWRWLALLAGGAVVGLIMLAGHTQAAYIVLFAAALYAFFRELRGLSNLDWRKGLRGLLALAAMTATGLLLAAAQLLPTLELSRLSVRSGGLPYNEAASFSLKPQLVFKAFLPPLAWEPPFSEYIAYIGLIGLALACMGAWSVLRHKHRGSVALLLALVGVFLAFGAYNPVYYILYKLVPGISLFRAPARWLLLYSFGAAILAGLGLQTLGRIRRWRWAVVLLLVIELFFAGQQLAYNQPTAPAAYDSMRTAPAHLLADQSGEPFRFLSMSDIRYDPGDMGDLRAMYQDQLSEDALYDLIVASKMKEVLAYNLPLRYRLFSVDGYDGGLLPISDYVMLERLFLDEGEIWPDGRLRQQLRRVPPARLLSLLNVKYVITDKTQDVWIDGVFYDLEHTVPLGEVSMDDLPNFETTHLGVVSYLTGTNDLAEGTPAAQVVVTAADGAQFSTTLQAGVHTSEGRYEPGTTAHRQAQVGHPWRDDDQGSDYIALLELDLPLRPASITIRSLLPGAAFDLRGLTLIDDSTGTSRNLSIHPAYRLVHSGDVKVYQNLDVLPRAFVIHNAAQVATEGEALELLQDPSFDPSREVLLLSEEARAEGQGPPEGKAINVAGTEATVDILSYEPEEVRLRATLDAPGTLVLADTFYPGWEATVDGRPAPILRADLAFRAVQLDAGEHLVTFRYRPALLRWGLALSLGGWLLLALVATIFTICTGRKHQTVV